MHENEDLDQINQQLAALISKKNELLSARRQTVVNTIKKQIAEYELTARELGLGNGDRASRFKPSNVPKYANPAQPSQTWAGGRGAKPIWVREHLEKGGTLEELLIK